MMAVDSIAAPAGPTGNDAMKTGARRFATRRHLWLITGIVAFAVAVRLPGLFTDLWLDEVWSLHDVLSLHSWTDIFVRLTDDNNHHLNSLWLYLLGFQTHAWTYRALAFVSGIATVFGAWMVGARYDRRTAAVMGVAFAGSYLLSYYSSEARGYAPVACMVVFAWYCLQRYLDTSRWAFAVGFWMCSALGVMSHPTYIQFLLGAFVWGDVHSQRTQRNLRSAAWVTARAFVPAMAFVGVFYIVSLSGLTISGGPPYVFTRVVAQTFSVIGGGPLDGGYMWAAALVVGAVFAISIFDAHRHNDDRWWLYLNVGLVIPAIFVGFSRPLVLFPRYFLVPIVVALMSMSVFVARLLASSGWRRVLGMSLILLYVSGGVIQVASLSTHGRGEYRNLVADILKGASNETMTVGSAPQSAGPDFRNGMLVEYFSRLLGADDRVQFVTEANYGPEGTDWLIRESLDAAPADPSYHDKYGRLYTLQSDYYASGMVPLTWHLYRRAASSGVR
jgi:hypothetical protein